MKNLALLGFCLVLISTSWSGQRDADIQKLEKAILIQKVASKPSYLVLNIDKNLAEEAKISEDTYYYDTSRREEEALKPSKIYVSPTGELSTYSWENYSKDFATPEAAAQYIEEYKVEKAKEDKEKSKRMKGQQEEANVRRQIDQREFQIRQQHKSKAAAR